MESVEYVIRVLNQQLAATRTEYPQKSNVSVFFSLRRIMNQERLDQEAVRWHNVC